MGIEGANNEPAQESTESKEQLVEEYRDLSQRYKELFEDYQFSGKEIAGKLDSLSAVSDQDDVFAHSTTLEEAEKEWKALAEEHDSLLEKMKEVVTKISDKDNSDKA